MGHELSFRRPLCGRADGFPNVFASRRKRQAYEIPRWDLPLGQCVRDPTGGDSETTCRGVAMSLTF
jgi:hypothetical protein